MGVHDLSSLSTLGIIPVLVATAASAVGSLSYLVNRYLSLSGESWAWNAGLRYLYLVIILIGIYICTRKGRDHIGYIGFMVRTEPLRWISVGTLGAGFFYGGICYGISVAPSWIVAAIWQTTIIFSIAALHLRGYRLSKLVISAMFGVFAGAVSINVHEAAIVDYNRTSLLLAMGAVLIAAIAYPLANQIVYERIRELEGSDHKEAKILKNPINCVFLAAIGSIPFWILLLSLVRPKFPNLQQLVLIFIVAITSGLISTGMFFFARNRASNARTVAAVDATQASQVVFALILEVAFLQAHLPSLLQGGGVLAIVGGIILISWDRNRKPLFPGD